MKCNAEKVGDITFPKPNGKRCLMMPFIQGDPSSVPSEFRNGYEDILSKLAVARGEIGFLTIDESFVEKGSPHRGSRAKSKRAIHTEGGRPRNGFSSWGGSNWGGSSNVRLNLDTQVLIANNLDDSCAIWDASHEDTTEDGDIGHVAESYPLSEAIKMKCGEVFRIGLFTPHESLPVKGGFFRQFLRIVGSGVHGREEYFTRNPLLALP